MSSAYMCIVAGVYRHPGYARLWPWIVRSVPHSYVYQMSLASVRDLHPRPGPGVRRLTDNQRNGLWCPSVQLVGFK